MDFFVVLTRAGRRVILRRRCRSDLGEKNGVLLIINNLVGNNQKVHAEEAQEWFKKKYEGLLVN